ncbi:hydrolase, partial [Mycobacterium sp. ITM-2017-0098]
IRASWISPPSISPVTSRTGTSDARADSASCSMACLRVYSVTGLIEGGEIQEARIVNRPEWIRAAAQSRRVMTGGGDKDAKPRAVSGRIAGLQTGAVLAFVSSGILGQYDP